MNYNIYFHTINLWYDSCAIKLASIDQWRSDKFIKFAFFIFIKGRIIKMKKFLRFLKEEEGVTAIEYGLIAALIAVLIIAAVTSVGLKLQGTFQAVDSALPW